ncbi:GNAT family N-acetyltransferase [Acrocarpospora phusangensis]|nr:GNAT family N-acetyltransferase [Acrocarpospora phusangensis]
MRQIRANAEGVPVISFVEGVREGRPWADLVEVLGPEADDLIMNELSGWVVSGSTELGERLLARGTRLVRHAHTMVCDLTDPGAWPAGSGDAPDGFAFLPVREVTPEDILPSWIAAYPPGHPDHHPRDSDKAFREELVPLMAGEIIGELLRCSGVAVDESGAVVAGVLVNRWNGMAWIGDVFRHPGKSPRGLGASLLRFVQIRAAEDGFAEMGLAVTYTNPAKKVYARLGFKITNTAMSVIIP